MVENFSNPVKHINLQIQEARKFINRVSPKKPTLRHIVIILLKTKGKEKKVLKSPQKKQRINKKRKTNLHDSCLT